MYEVYLASKLTIIIKRMELLSSIDQNVIKSLKKVACRVNLN